MNDLWSILILLLIVQGVFALSLILVFPKRRNRIENRYLTAIILVLLWFLFEFYCIRNKIEVPINFFYGSRYGSWFLLGPLTYLFIRSIADGRKFNVRDWWHFLPFVVFVLIIPWASDESLSNRQIHYGMLAVFDYRPKTVTAFEYLYSTVFYMQFVHLTTYLVANHFILKIYTKNIKSVHSQVNETVWLYVFNGLIFFLVILVSLYLYILFASNIYTRSLDYIYVVPIGLFIYAMSYKLSGLEWKKTQKVHERYRSSNLKPEQERKLMDGLEQLMSREKPYLQNELRLNDLANTLSTSTHHLSQVINTGTESSFFDYINKFRIAEAKKIISNHPEHTLLKVAFDAGFNNKTSFVNAFKKFEGTTPSKYRKQIISQLSNS